MAGMWDRQQSMWKGRGGSSLPECCYSGPHASASVSANERNSALFHLVSLDQELASPKTDAARGTEGGRERERQSHSEIQRERKMRRKISVIDREMGEREGWGGGGTGFLDGEVNINTNSLSLCPSHTCCSILTRQSQVRWRSVRQPLIGPWWTPKMRGQPLNTEGGKTARWGSRRGHRSEVNWSLHPPPKSTPPPPAPLPLDCTVPNDY